MSRTENMSHQRRMYISKDKDRQLLLMVAQKTDVSSWLAKENSCNILHISAFKDDLFF